MTTIEMSSIAPNSENVIELTEAGIIGLETLCRLCANRTDHLIPIYEGEGAEHELEMKMNRYLPFKVEQSQSMPMHCCYQCASTVLQWHELVEVSLEANRRLRALQEDAIVHLTQKYPKADEHPVGLEIVSDSASKCSTSHKYNENSQPEINERFEKERQISHENEIVKYIRIKTEPVMTEECISKRNYFEVDDSENETLKIIKIDTNDDDESENKPEIDPLELKEVKPIYLCQKCEVMLDNDEELTLHIARHSENISTILTNSQIENTNNMNECSVEESNTDKDTIDYEKMLNCNIIKPVKHDIVQDTTNILYGCPICLWLFETKSEWFSHNDNHTLDIKCDECERMFCHEMYLKEHKHEEHYLFEMCYLCGLVFRDDKLLDKHLEEHLQCGICDERFKSKLALKSHRRIHGISKKQKRTGQPKYKCDGCPKYFVKESSLLYHQQSGHAVNILSYRCHLCEMSFLKGEALKYHILNHDMGDNFICEICSKEFNRTCNLNAHIVTHIKDYYCKVCCRSYITQFRLENHMSAHNEKEIRLAEKQPHSVMCPFENCDMTFPSRFQLYEHKKTHLGIVEFCCDVCPRKFKTEPQLLTHRKSHEADTDCRTCGKHFSNVKTLREHLRLHTGEKPFTCDVCGMRFRCQSSLVGHRAVHSTEKKYRCSICERAFARSNYLKEHLRTHRNERPFECQYCGQCFTQSNVLKTHVNLKHRVCNVCQEVIGNKVLLREHLVKFHNITMNDNYSLSRMKLPRKIRIPKNKQLL